MSERNSATVRRAHVPAALLVRLAYRSLLRNRRRTLITLSSIALGLALAIVAKSISTGVYRQAINDMARSLAGHLTVEDPGYRASLSPDRVVKALDEVVSAARSLPHVVDVRLRVEFQAVLATAKGSANVALTSDKSLVERARPALASNVVAGAWPTADDDQGVVVGADLARRLGAGPGSKMVLTVNDVTGELRSELLCVRGIFRTGAESADGSLAWVPLSVAQRVLALAPEQVNQVAVVLSSHSDEPAAREALAARLAGKRVVVHSWIETAPELAGWIALDTRVNDIQRGILFALIAFTILNTMLMSVLERKREFAVLLALGTPDGLLRGQIAVEAFMLAALGTACGCVLGLAGSLWLQTYGIDLSSLFRSGFAFSGVMIDPWVHAYVSSGVIGSLALAVLVITLLMGAYPMFRATRVDVASSLRSR